MVRAVSLSPSSPARTSGVPLAARLAEHGDRVAIVTHDMTLSYRELAARVDDAARQLGATRRLVVVAATNQVEPLVAYLAALAGGHPVLLAPGDDPRRLAELVRAYDPDVVAAPTAAGWALQERRPGTAHDLHPDLALLLSTSGSTGSPRLVRLSRTNVQANAESIVAYLGLGPADRAATTLPLHYCYGLSVVHTHLLVGASLVLTDRSVADAEFWQLFRSRGCTGLAGVPYTFELLDRMGFEGMSLPALRYLTSAGGRLPPDRVRRYAELGRRAGWDLVVMYGQTEATARMAYLPPELARSHPASIGVPIPGGSFSLEPLPGESDASTGELVYDGPNVMLGYAETPADLACGREVHRLRTGDIARRTPEGLYELLGRRSRFAKLFGLRIDLQRVEAAFDGSDLTVCCLSDDRELVLAVEGSADLAATRRLAAQHSGLPARCVRVCPLATLPRLGTGKPDYSAVGQLVGLDCPEPRSPQTAAPVRPPERTTEQELLTLYAELLDRGDVSADSTFVSLRGDSLSYVEMSVQLESRLGALPADWHRTPIRELAAATSPDHPDRSRARTRAAPRREHGPAAAGRWWGAVETSVGLRAVAIVLIVGTHANLFTVLGGAHALIGVAGFNVARFCLASSDRRERVGNLARTAARIAVPSVVWIGGVALVSGMYAAPTALLLNNALGPEKWTLDWQFWFVEALVWILVALVAAFSLPLVDRAERVSPYTFAVGGPLLLGLLARFDVVTLDVGVNPYTPVVVFWFFAWGWAAAVSTTVRQRLFLTAVLLFALPGLFNSPVREGVVGIGLLLLLWVASVPCPRPVLRVAALLAGTSLYTYLTHWVVYPHLENDVPVLAVAASFAAGIAYWKVAGLVAGHVTARARGALLTR